VLAVLGQLPRLAVVVRRVDPKPVERGPTRVDPGRVVCAGEAVVDLGVGVEDAVLRVAAVPALAEEAPWMA